MVFEIRYIRLKRSVIQMADAFGFLAEFISVVGRGSYLVPMKKLQNNNIFYFQELMATGILLSGLVIVLVVRVPVEPARLLQVRWQWRDFVTMTYLKLAVIFVPWNRRSDAWR